MFGKRQTSIVFSRIAVCTLALVALTLTAALAGGAPAIGPVMPGPPTTHAPVTDGQDLVIPLAEVTDIASFYPVIVDGFAMEVLAVRAPDGTVRTAFNACQVCYDSGSGYYVQEGGVLVCQNCGARFRLDQVEVARGGCNPMPILPEDKTVDDEDITISADYFAQARQIFESLQAAEY
jgi:uncharacterized membrane protein